MTPILERFIGDLRTACGDAVLDVTEFRDDVTVLVRKDAVVDVARHLRDNTVCIFELCEDVFGIDQYTRKNRFEVKYTFLSLKEKERLHLKVQVDESDCSAPTITAVYPAANWYERETYDMIGVRFTGHPDMRRAYMPEDFEYYPLRKDFPLMGVPGSIPLPKR